MAVPYMARALRGWTTKKSVTVITQTVVDHKAVNTPSAAVLVDINIQPVPASVVNRKPEEQRTWKWWSIIVIAGPLYKTDDIIAVDGINYKIMVTKNWSESGFQKYEAIEDYT